MLNLSQLSCRPSMTRKASAFLPRITLNPKFPVPVFLCHQQGENGLREPTHERVQSHACMSFVEQKGGRR